MRYFVAAIDTLRAGLLAGALCLWLLPATLSLRAQDNPPGRPSVSITVYPIVFRPDKNILPSVPRRAAEVVGLLLEKEGIQQIELAESHFSPGPTDDMEALSKDFASWVRRTSPKTDYAVVGIIEGTHQTGITRIYTIAVDRDGKQILAERADRKVLDRAAVKPVDPMTASIYLVSRLKTVTAIRRGMGAPPQDGKMAAVMRQRSGLPPEEELQAMDQRLDKARTDFATSDLTVYPIQFASGSDSSSAADLARQLNDQGICRAVASALDPKLEFPVDPNELKMLWESARGFQAFVRQHPPTTRYALLANYGIAASGSKREARFVHLVICDRAGDWIMVDLQNSHHPDFQRTSPRTSRDCNRLAVLRIRQRLAPVK